MKKLVIVFAGIIFALCIASLAQENKKMTKKEREAAWKAERLKKREAERAREAREDSIEFVQAVQALQGFSSEAHKMAALSSRARVCLPEPAGPLIR